MDISLTNEPVSSKNPALLALVDEHLANSEVCVALIRYANSAGAKDRLLIRVKDEFETLLKTLAPKTSMTVFFESAFLLKGSADSELLKKAEIAFAKEYDEYEGLEIVCIKSQEGNESGMNILFMQKMELIEEWFREHTGSQTLIGTMKFWHNNNENFITAYVPDNDGCVRPGAY
jgi:hypothetical protein